MKWKSGVGEGGPEKAVELGGEVWEDSSRGPILIVGALLCVENYCDEVASAVVGGRWQIGFFEFVQVQNFKSSFNLFPHAPHRSPIQLYRDG